MLPNSNYRDREIYNKTILKQAQDYQRVRQAEEWNEENKAAEKQPDHPKQMMLFRPVLRLVELVLITLGL